MRLAPLPLADVTEKEKEWASHDANCPIADPRLWVYHAACTCGAWEHNRLVAEARAKGRAA